MHYEALYSAVCILVTQGGDIETDITVVALSPP